LGTRSGSTVSPTRESGGGVADDLGAVVGLEERAAAPVAPVAVAVGEKTEGLDAPVAEAPDAAAAVAAAPAAPGFLLVAPACPPGFCRAEPVCAAGSCRAVVGETEGEDVRVGGDPAEAGECALGREAGTPAGGSALSAFLPKPQRSRRDRRVGASVGESQTGTPACCPPDAG